MPSAIFTSSRRPAAGRLNSDVRRHPLHSMPTKELQLRRRRWTLVFSLPFTLVMVAVGAYSIFLLFTAEERFVLALAGCGTFISLCLVATIGKAVLEALYDLRPAVVIDSTGLIDRRGSAGLIPWHEIERVKLDVDEQQILVNMAGSASPDRRKLISTTRRLIYGTDYTIALVGLRYDSRELERSLAEHHRQGINRRPVSVASGA